MLIVSHIFGICCSVDEFFECLDTGSMLLATGTFSNYTMGLTELEYLRSIIEFWHLW